jgi:hypothetical protein
MAADGSCAAAVDTQNAGPIPAPAAEMPDVRQDERDSGERAPRTPSPWDADSDVHPVLERFKRVNLCTQQPMMTLAPIVRPAGSSAPLPLHSMLPIAPCTALRNKYAVRHQRLRRAGHGGHAGEGGRARHHRCAPAEGKAESGASGAGGVSLLWCADPAIRVLTVGYVRSHLLCGLANVSSAEVGFRLSTA